jgi:hypothetical protein
MAAWSACSQHASAYSSVLEQLGCSREVGLWLAMIEVKNEGYRVGRGESFRWMEPLRVAVMRDLHIYSSLQKALKQRSTQQSPQPAALHLSVSGGCLEWLSNMPCGRLLDMGANVAAVCMVAAEACDYGQGT